jgi:hypothetical protein
MSRKREKVCMPNPGNAEYSLCGDAFDAVGDIGCEEVEPFRIGAAGDVVTCKECRRMIDIIRSIRRYRVPADDDA